MHRIIIVAALFVAFGASGQSIGIRASIGSSWFGIKESSGESYWSDGGSSMCWSVGVASEINIYKSICLQPEVSFAQTSGSYQLTSEYNAEGEKERNYTFWEPAKINQVQISVLPKVKAGRVYFMIGPSYSVLFKNPNTMPLKGQDYLTIHQNFNKNDIALNTSFGVNIIKKPQVSIEVRHYRGFVKLDNLGYHQSSISLGSSILF